MDSENSWNYEAVAQWNRDLKYPLVCGRTVGGPPITQIPPLSLHLSTSAIFVSIFPNDYLRETRKCLDGVRFNEKIFKWPFPRASARSSMFIFAVRRLPPVITIQVNLDMRSNSSYKSSNTFNINRLKSRNNWKWNWTPFQSSFGSTSFFFVRYDGFYLNIFWTSHITMCMHWVW